jgi:hypothetical protein
MEKVKLDVQILVEFVLLGKICRSSLSPAMIETDTSFWPSFLSGVPQGAILRGCWSKMGGGGGAQETELPGSYQGRYFLDIFILSFVFKISQLRTSQ